MKNIFKELSEFLLPHTLHEYGIVCIGMALGVLLCAGLLLLALM